MDSVEQLADLLIKFQNTNKLCEATVVILTPIGLVYISWIILKIIYHSIQGLRLYFFSQICCTTSYAKRYGKWALITGATDGIGLDMAKELAKRGQSIIIVGRNEQKLIKSRDEILNFAGNEIEVLTAKIDLSDPNPENYKTVRELINPNVRDIGLLINNAGTFPSELMNFDAYDEKQFLTIINVNIVSVLYFTKMILPGMIDRGRGCIVNISSSGGEYPSPYMNVYGPSKAFVSMFSRNLIYEYSSFPIDIINVTPGSIQTKMFIETIDNHEMKKSNPFNPYPDVFARGLINSLSTRIPKYCGCIGHAFVLHMIKFSIKIGLYHKILRFGLESNSSKFYPSTYSRSKTNRIQDSIELTS